MEMDHIEHRGYEAALVVKETQPGKWRGSYVLTKGGLPLQGQEGCTGDPYDTKREAQDAIVIVAKRRIDRILDSPEV